MVIYVVNDRNKKWIDVVKAVNLDPDSKVLCPECERATLQIEDIHFRQDIHSRPDIRRLERRFTCPNCGAFNSARMTLVDPN